LPFLTLRQVSKRYGTRRVLDNVNLAVEEGEFVSIVGASASGKTTLLNIAAGLAHADRGTVTLGGAPVERFPREAAIVFQNYSLLPWYSALDNVRLAVEAAFPDWSRERHTEQAKKYLEMVGLGSALAKRPGQLSGGMRQRVAIARAFAVEPRLLFLDEPFGALDALTRATLQNELSAMCSASARPVTTLLITNSVDEAILLSDRVFALSRGPGATLGSPIPVNLSRPRNAGLLLHDEQAVRIRAKVAESVAGGASLSGVPAPHPAALVAAEASS
jgi:nitrate/nitrite transport system ATP-binding protein